MKPQELLERRERTARQYEALAHSELALSRALGFEGNFTPAQEFGQEIPDHIRHAVCYWWEPSILSLALVSPLPKNYIVPEWPYGSLWMAFPGTDTEAWGSILFYSDPQRRIIQLAPEEFMTEHYAGYTRETFAAKLLIFLDSPYVTTEYRKPHGKSAIRRVGKEGVHFVVLRQPKTNPKAALRGNGHIDWNSRWMVRGHYRNQWYPSRSAHATVWIASYIKGPADKPIREPVYRVAR